MRSQIMVSRPSSVLNINLALKLMASSKTIYSDLDVFPTCAHKKSPLVIPTHARAPQSSMFSRIFKGDFVPLGPSYGALSLANRTRIWLSSIFHRFRIVEEGHHTVLFCSTKSPLPFAFLHLLQEPMGEHRCFSWSLSTLEVLLTVEPASWLCW